MGARPTEIDDMVQDVFLAAHRKGGYRAGPASPTTFLAQLALEANLAGRRRYRRWQSAHSDDAARAALGVSPLQPDAALAAARAARRLDEALASMDEDRRAVFVLFELQGESCDAIAAGLGLPVGTVYSRLHAARRTFRESVTRSARRDESPPRLAAKESA
jgi:RNA polymerase sigma-70 factor (ECF subfamily)